MASPGNIYIYSLTDLGIPLAAIPVPGDEFTTSADPAPDFLNVSDDDPLLNEATFNPITGLVIPDFNQVLGADLTIDGALVGNPGDLVVPDAGSIAFVTSTGQAITGYLIIIVDPITGIGNPVGVVTTLPVPANTTYTYTGSGGSSTVPYADLAHCFTQDTMIECENGPVPVQDIVEGDLVVTRDNGLQAVRWVGRRTVVGVGPMAPIRIMAGALDNAKDLRVSPMHRMVISGPRAEVLYGISEVLAHASHLCDGDRIYREPVAEVTYFHVLFDHHEIISAFGCWSESFAPSEAAIGAVDDKSRAELLTLFPELGADWQDVLPTLTAAEARLAL